ncbi:MAG TPA: cytochrome c [Thermoanaerobaculia bacterium]|nr:cytochrome c [Thermoanaerobaculia bacterium]
MRTAARATLVLLALIGAAALAGGLGFAAMGLSARREPPALEVRVARAARHLLVPSAARRRPNPVAVDGEILDRARAHFADHCATCHGNDGKGATPFGSGMYPRTPDLTAPATQQLSDGELFFYIEQGIKLTGMPAFGTGTPDGERESWELVHFLRRLPRLGPEDLAEMKRLNPVSRAELEAELAAEAFLRGEDTPTATSSQPHHH